ncbi:MAG: MupA/Atu3671 family FMN-dependent luciferase-like monooxygenase, partial [Cyanobacteria bacterium P01_A01_bin.83]
MKLAIVKASECIAKTNFNLQRALLLYPSGLEFIAAFFGCLYAGVVAVPVYPPKRDRKLSCLLAIVNDAGARIALTTTAILNDIEKRWANEGELTQLKWLATDTIETTPQEFVPTSIAPDSLAFLQYTSGSTGMPKGVTVTHGSIMHNEQSINRAFGHSEESICVGWLPLFHDMGLIGQTLQPIYVGFPSILMPPLAFLQKPIRWLKAISKYRATTSGGPNFAYDLCVEKIKPEQLAELDLSSWDLAYIGAEPVRAKTLEKFAEKFAACGFNYSAFYPCYGMAEATLFATGGEKGQKPVIQGVKAKDLEQNLIAESDSDSESRSLVGCGRPYSNTKVIIADPESLIQCEERQIGEIWLSGGSIAAGYWNRPQLSRETFEAYLQDTESGSFLRTGDLGFLQDGELFFTGRLKDLIIIRGRNHYPQDIEITVEKSHPGLRSHHCAAFSVEVAGEEKLVVVQEVERTYLRKLNLDEAIGAIRQQVTLEHELQVYAVVLIKPGTILKTSSGKIQRHACRHAFLAKNLSVVGCSILERTQPLSPDRILIAETTQPKQFLPQLRQQIARSLQVSLASIQPEQLLSTLGLDSLQAVEIKNYIEDEFGVVIPMEKFFERLTVAQLATYIGKAITFPTVNEHQSSPHPEKLQPEASDSLAVPKSESENTTHLVREQNIQFSLLYFSSNEAEFTDDKYQLFLEGAKFADRHDFKAVWIPERHFNAFGGIYPNPSVLGAALATITNKIRIRAGSVVLPLHNPIRVAEDWSVVDNLSQGRVDLAFAMGWNANDFAIAPQNYRDRHSILFSGIETVRELWQGKSISVPNGVSKLAKIKIYPLPKQRELDVWITCSGGAERFAEAGNCGANILTALLFQSVEELAEKIAIYRQARAKNGYDQDGCVTLMLHTFIDEDLDVVRQKVRQPFIKYLESSVNLWRNNSQNLDELSEPERQDLLAFAFERYFRTSTLFGTPDSCANMVKRLQEVGVNEIACLIDFGVDRGSVMEMLKHLNSLQELVNSKRSLEDFSEAINLEEDNKTSISMTEIDLDSRFRLAYKSGKNVLQRAFEFDLPNKLRATGILPYFQEL